MTEQIILQHLFLMPETLKQEVLHYIFYLSSSYNNSKQIDIDFQQNLNLHKDRKPVFGSAKEKYILSSDFDEPIEDFKEYMQ
jgi:hypothetical protein